MTQRDDPSASRQPPSPQSETDEARSARVQEVIDAGREEDLSEEDYQYAIQNGLIEG